MGLTWGGPVAILTMPITPLKPSTGSLLDLAVSHVVAYILGCQPELYRRESVSSRANRTAVEPDNLCSSGWLIALDDLAQWQSHTHQYSPELIMRRVVLTATIRAFQAGLDLGIHLPLKRPRAFRFPPAASWSELNPYFQALSPEVDVESHMWYNTS